MCIRDRGSGVRGFAMILEGEIRATRLEMNGSETPLAVYQDGDTFGEAPLLLGSKKAGVRCVVTRPLRMLLVSEEGFWKLMATCPNVRQGIMANAAQRLSLIHI